MVIHLITWYGSKSVPSWCYRQFPCFGHNAHFFTDIFIWIWASCSGQRHALFFHWRPSSECRVNLVPSNNSTDLSGPEGVCVDCQFHGRCQGVSTILSPEWRQGMCLTGSGRGSERMEEGESLALGSLWVVSSCPGWVTELKLDNPSPLTDHRWNLLTKTERLAEFMGFWFWSVWVGIWGSFFFCQFHSKSKK